MKNILISRILYNQINIRIEMKKKFNLFNLIWFEVKI